MSWRVGTKNPLNVYEGDRSVCQCHTPEDAARIVMDSEASEVLAYMKASGIGMRRSVNHAINWIRERNAAQAKE